MGRNLKVGIGDNVQGFVGLPYWRFSCHVIIIRQTFINDTRLWFIFNYANQQLLSVFIKMFCVHLRLMCTFMTQV